MRGMAEHVANGKHRTIL